ncbi:MAG: tetratricopeptide repeat protein [Bacteroidetes bacterium]|nr:tetratricopeptide repeat protein [Bacteroidota bacterium]
MDSATKRYTQIAIVALCIIAFFPVFTGDFTNYDDPEYVLNNSYVHHFSFENIRHIFLGKTTDLFVPLTVFSYLIEYSLFGANPKAFHAVNLLLHCINALLLLHILLNLRIKNKSLIHLLIVFFAIHPLVTESVCWITERKDVLYCLFYFLSAIQFLNYDHSKQLKHLLLCLLYFILACLSKPMAVSLPFLFTLYLIYSSYKLDFKKLVPLLPFYGISAFFSIVSINAIASLGSVKSNLVEYGFLKKTALVVSEIGYYFFKPFMPVNQSLFHLFPKNTELLSNTSILLFLILGLVASIICLYLGIYKKQRLVLFLFLAWLIFLAPILQIYSNTHSYVSERYFYMSIVFPIGITFLVLEYYQIKLLAQQYVLVLLIFVFTLLTFNRSRIWKNTKTLFESELKQNPENAYALNNLGMYYNTRSDYMKASVYLKKAIGIDSTNAFYLNNYGWSLAALGQPQEAIIYLQKAIHENANYTEALSNMGICYIKTQQYNKAFDCFKKAHELSPENPDVLFNLGLYYMNSHQPSLGLPLLEKAYSLGNTKALKYLNK